MKVNNIPSATIALSVVGALLMGPLWAEEPEAAEPATSEETTGPALNYRTGDVTLPNKVATLHLGNRYRYIDAADTEKMLVAWGNPPGSETEGAVIPADVEPFSETGWAVILTYEKDGHVDDSDARKIDYQELLGDMKEGTESSNEARKKAGFAPLHLIGWAETPHYDGAENKLYWAKELEFEGSQSHTLNYDVRVLGREGVLSMNAVAVIDQLPQIRGEMNPLIKIAEFNAGYRYADFNPKTDKLAEYGLAALVAGGVATKLGLFGKLFAFILAFKKALIAGVIASFGLITRFFKKKDATT